MLSTLIGIARAMERAAARVIQKVGDWVARRLTGVWATHLERVAGNAGYAAATAAVVAGVLGLMSARDVLAAVIAGALGIYLRGAHEAGGAIARPSSRWDVA
jgi:hypothetical protein